MKTKLLFLLLLPACFLTAQDLPTPIVGDPFAKPGIRGGSPGKGFNITYERHPNYELQGGSVQDGTKAKNDVERKERFEAKMKIPLVLKGNWKILGDVYYGFEKYDFDSIAPPSNFAFRAIDKDALKRTRLTMYAFRSLSPKHYIAFRMETSSNGNYNGFLDLDKKYMVYRVAGIFGIKKNEDNELGFGLMANNGFARTSIYPFMVYNHNFNEKWGLETVLPIKYSLRHNISEKSLITFAAEYWSSAYAVDLKPPGTTDSTPYIFRSSAAQFFAEWEKNLINAWTWVSFRVGYSYNFDSRFVLGGTRNERQIDAFPSNSIFFSASFFLSPPKKFMEANTRSK